MQAKAVIFTPSHLDRILFECTKTGESFSVGLKVEDVWGNPIGRVRKVRRKGFKSSGVRAIPFCDRKTGLSCETNPIVVRDRMAEGRWWADFHAQSEETIGSNSVESYFAFARDKALVDIASHQGNDFQITDKFWARLNRTTKAVNRRGLFVAFPGFEWSGNTGVGGDRNVLYRTEGQPISRSCRALIDEEDASFPDSKTADDLFRMLKGRDAIVFAHVGGRFADLDMHAEDVELGVEIHSSWGTAEWMLADALERGYRVGVFANSDGHKGRPGAEYPGASTFGSRCGLTCVLSRKLDRASVWQALKKRHFYATTGARMFLDVRTDSGAMMGDVIKAKTVPSFSARVVGTGALERVEFRNGMDVIRTFRPFSAREVGRRVKILWSGAMLRGRERSANWDGGVRVKGGRIVGFEPVNFDNPLHVCESAGENSVRWKSLTTGSCAGVIIELADANRGTLEVETLQKKMKVDLKKLGAGVTSARCGGLNLKLEVYRLPDVNGVREMRIEEFTPRKLHPGDNPIYVHVVQEDGQRAWSSPIYVVRKRRRATLKR